MNRTKIVTRLINKTVVLDHDYYITQGATPPPWQYAIGVLQMLTFLVMVAVLVRYVILWWQGQRQDRPRSLPAPSAAWLRATERVSAPVQLTAVGGLATASTNAGADLETLPGSLECLPAAPTLPPRQVSFRTSSPRGARPKRRALQPEGDFESFLSPDEDVQEEDYLDFHL